MIHAQQGAALVKHTTLAIVRLTQVESHPALGRDLVPDPPENVLLEHTKCSAGGSFFWHSLGLFSFYKVQISPKHTCLLCYWPQRKNCTGFIKGVEEFCLDLITNLNNL